MLRPMNLMMCLGCFIPLTSVANTHSLTITPNSVEQETTCVGVVKDTSGETVIGASVVVKGTTMGTITDIDGKFSLPNVEKGAELEISFVGYRTLTVKWTGKELNLKLEDDTQTLDEVVVVGFGAQKKANLTGAVSSVKMDEIVGDRPITTVSDALQGTVPGLLVSNTGNQAGSGKSFQLRGAYTIGSKSGNSYGAAIAPLILIDNVEGSMDMLNPEDIESITVLKDAASTAIYGARAAGGVILITTKRPHGKTSFRLNYNNSFGFANSINLPKQAPLMDYLNTFEEMGWGDKYWAYGNPSVSKWKEYLAEYQKNPSAFNTVGDGIYKDEDGKIYYLKEHDPYESFMETSFQQKHNISMSGGTDKLRYRMSGGFVKNDGVLITDKDTYERFNISSYISADITSWFTQEATLSYARTKSSKPNSTIGGIYSTGLVSYHPEGYAPSEVWGTEKDLPFNTPLNQVLLANTNDNSTDRPRVFLKSILKPIKNFEVAFEYTFDKTISNSSFYSGVQQYTDIQGATNKFAGESGRDYLQQTKSNTDYNAINLYGTYSFDINKEHNFKAMIGFNQESSYYHSLMGKAYDMPVPEVPSLGSGVDSKTTDSYNEYSVRGAFFRVNYNFQDKYLVEINGRYDGSSKFPKKNRFGFFPSVSVGWNMAQEKFMDFSRDVIDGLKLRASYGGIGNQNIVNYAYYSDMTINNMYNGWIQNGNFVTAINSLPALVSTSYTWEKVYTTDLGLDLNMFNNRFNVVFDWYQRDTKGMLAPGMQLPAVVGTSAPFENTADMRTRGWELAVNWRDRIGGFNYRVGFNISDSESVITKYDDNEASKLISTFYRGQKIGEIWGFETDGFYTVDDFVDTNNWQLKEGVVSINGVSPRPGDVKLKNLRDDENSINIIDKGDGTLDNPGDMKVIGNELPRYLYGITLGASYKGFDLNVMMQGTGKRDAWIANNLTAPMFIYSQNDIQFQPLFEGLTDYWRPVDAANGDYTAANPDAKYPRIYDKGNNSGYNYGDGYKKDSYLLDASYFRIKNITLSYTVPKKWISKIKLDQLKAFVSVENVATFDKLPSGIDPEMLKWDYPAFRTVSFGINFTL